jgi:predicted peptidase
MAKKPEILRATLSRTLLGTIVGLTVFPPLQATAVDGIRQKPYELNRAGVTMKYLLYLPKGYEQKASWPLLLFLHGLGERGDDLNQVRNIGVAKMIKSGWDFPLVVVSPQCPKTEQWWKPAKLTVLLDEIVEKHKIDQDRIYVTGLSMGGFGTWALATFTPNRFAAIIPICGRGDPANAKNIAHIPTWVFHGAKDPVVPLEAAETMVEALRKNGGNVRFTVYPEAKHDAWTQTYANPQVYKWLLQQKRTVTKPDESRK